MSLHLLPSRIRAGYAGLVLVTFEETRAIDHLARTAQDLQRPLYLWSCTSGLQSHPGNADSAPVLANADLEHPFPMLSEILNNKVPDDSIVLLSDCHLFLREPNPALYRRFKDALTVAKARGIVIVLMMPELHLPLDLEKDFAVIDFDLPGPAELTACLEHLCYETNSDTGERTAVRPMPQGDELEALLDAAAGLTTTEAENAFALSLIEGGGQFHAPTVLSEKAATMKKNGLIEYIEPKLTLDDVGGWDAFKAHITASRFMFSKQAAAYGLRPFKGDLLCGQPGTGKTLISPIIGAVLGIPILRVRAENLKGSLMGQTEQNWKRVIQTAKSLRRCLIHLDDVEGMLSGHQSSGRTDGGTVASLVKAIIQDIQESEGIYFVLTANNIDDIPAPLIDRLNLWSVELPNQTERGEILQIQMARTGRNHKQVCPKGLTNVTQLLEGYSGRQIERVWLKALNLAFTDQMREPTEADLIAALKGEVPTSTSMAAEIEARRKRLDGIARPVTSPTMQAVLTGGSRKIQAAG
jgi:AAA+ superfamily predicted ATPase